jgi:hypothetical protein
MPAAAGVFFRRARRRRALPVQFSRYSACSRARFGALRARSPPMSMCRAEAQQNRAREQAGITHDAGGRGVVLPPGSLAVRFARAVQQILHLLTRAVRRAPREKLPQIRINLWQVALGSPSRSLVYQPPAKPGGGHSTKFHAGDLSFFWDHHRDVLR